MPVSALSPDGWSLERPDVHALMTKFRKTGKPLGAKVKGRMYRGVLTGLNEAFVIDKATRQQLVDEDLKSAEVIRPWLRGRDIRKWKAEWAGLYIIAIASSANHEWPWSEARKEAEALTIFKKAFPAIYNHLLPFVEALRKHDDQGKFFWELRSCAYYGEFEKAKIVWRHFAPTPEFIYDKSKHFSNDKSYILPTDNLCLLGILNSPVTNFFIQQLSPPVRGGFPELRIIYMEQLPIPDVSKDKQKPIVKLVDEILAAKKKDPNADTTVLEKRIDDMVYALYGPNAGGDCDC